MPEQVKQIQDLVYKWKEEPMRPCVNHDFFKTWSPEMAWCLGLLYTDGNLFSWRDIRDITKLARVRFTNTDVDTINKFSSFTNGYIQKPCIRPSRKPLYNVDIYSKIVYEDLVKLGLMERKTHNLSFPDNFPEKFMCDFLRGIWDGDGGIYNYTGKFICSFTSSSLSFVEKLAEYLSYILNSNIKFSSKEDKYQIKLFSDNAYLFCRTIYHKDMKNAYMIRKYEVWNKYSGA